MLLRRIYQFLIIYLLGILILMTLKYSLELSNYVVPDGKLMFSTFGEEFFRYLHDTMNTLSVAVVGQVVSVTLALAVGIIGRQTTWFGSFVKVAAYNVQAYPIVALAPIIFILIGDGFFTRLIIAAMICYFPLLLSILGIMADPIRDIEHFYETTGRMRWQLQVKIRAFENLSKLTTVISGSATLAMAGTIVAEFIAANAGIGYSIRVALYQSDLAKILAALFLIGISLSIYQGILEWAGSLAKKAWATS
jgi:NitT/TauT family transport system permease protein